MCSCQVGSGTENWGKWRQLITAGHISIKLQQREETQGQTAGKLRRIFRDVGPENKAQNQFGVKVDWFRLIGHTRAIVMLMVLGLPRCHSPFFINDLMLMENHCWVFFRFIFLLWAICHLKSSSQSLSTWLLETSLSLWSFLFFLPAQPQVCSSVIATGLFENPFQDHYTKIWQTENCAARGQKLFLRKKKQLPGNTMITIK